MKKLFAFVLLAPATAFAHPGHGAQLSISRAPLLVLTSAAVALAAWGWAKARAHDQG